MARVVETFKTHALERERKKVRARERERESARACVCERVCGKRLRQRGNEISPTIKTNVL